MKFAALSIILPATVFAGKTDIALQVEAMAQNVSVSERNLIPILGPQLAHIDGYGCWCYRVPRTVISRSFVIFEHEEVVLES